MKPHYSFNDFTDNCAFGIKKVYVSKGAQDTANLDFNLPSQKHVLDFIGNDGLENPKFINSAPWINNPKPKNRIMVDAYSFYSGSLYGYLAFLFQDKTGKWVIKSFKKNREFDPRKLCAKSQLN